MSEFSKCPSCGEVKCFGYEEGYCLVLNNNDFGDRDCPFFKTKEQVAEEREYCKNHMDEIRIKEK